MSPALDRLAQTGRWRCRSTLEKALLSFGLLGLALALPPWPGAALVLGLAWAVALAGARVSLAVWGRLVAAPFGFLIVGLAALAVEIGPDGVALARDHGRLALETGLRAAAAVSAMLLLAATTPSTDLMRAARRLGVPAEIADFALLTWRFAMLLLESAAQIRAAQEARLGWHGPRRALRSAGLLIALLLPRALERARWMEIGLAARGDGALRTLAPSRPVSAPFVAASLGGFALIAGAALWLR